MSRDCDQCMATYEAKRNRAPGYCSNRCRQAAYRGLVMHAVHPDHGSALCGGGGGLGLRYLRYARTTRRWDDVSCAKCWAYYVGTYRRLNGVKIDPERLAYG